jgi:23S rRNA pseudouridine2605 synthase
MCEAVGHPVRALKRISIGELALGDLPEGAWRHATAEDLVRIFANTANQGSI